MDIIAQHNESIYLSKRISKLAFHDNSSLVVGSSDRPTTPRLASSGFPNLVTFSDAMAKLEHDISKQHAQKG